MCVCACICINLSNLLADQPLEKCCGSSISKAASKLQCFPLSFWLPLFSSALIHTVLHNSQQVQLNKITVLFTHTDTHTHFHRYEQTQRHRAYRVPHHLLASAIHTTVLCVCSDSMACEGESLRSQLEHTKHPSLLFFLLHISSFRTQQLPSPERHSEPLKCYILLNF